MSPIVDGSSIKDFAPIEGTFNCRLESFANKEAKAKDSTNVNLTFIVDDGEYVGRKLFVTRSLKPQALWSFKKTCMALGADAEEFVGEFDTDDILRPLVGSECRVKASIQTEGQYAGRQQVDDVLAPGFDLS